MRSPRSLLVAALLCAPWAAARGQSTPEVEPNDGAPVATLARLGDTISGTVNPDDVDYFAVDLVAGAHLELIADRVPFCRDFSLLDPSGNRIAFGDCMAGIDTLRVTIAAPGRYLIRVTEFDDAPIEQPMRPYTLHIGITSAGTTLRGVVSALLAWDASGLDSTTMRWLDQRGNGNGKLDAGDLRAYLRAEGLLP